MNEGQKSGRRRTKRWQLLSFFTIMISAVGLYYGVSSGEDWITWVFMALVTIGMALAVWA